MNIIQGKGKEFSRISVEIEQQFKLWLNLSKLNEGDLSSILDKNDFQIELIKDIGYECVVLKRRNLIIGEPFIWDINTGVQYERYWVELGLILYHFCSKTKNRESIIKIQQLIKNNK